MSTTQSPIKGNEHTFTPRELSSPNKNTPVIAKTVYAHVSKFHSLLTDWIKQHEKGIKICKTISALKLYEYTNEYYPQHLKQLSGSIKDIVDSFQNVIEGITAINTQLKALAQLPPLDQAVISTWTTHQISDQVNTTLESLKQEYKLKSVILENICHCRDEKLIEVYVSGWEFNIYVNLDSNAYLFADVGLSMI